MATRLPFRLPEWNPRITWASTQAREVWAPRISRISNIYHELERQLVIERIRQSALQNVTAEALPETIKAVAPFGLVVLPLTRVPRAQGYQSAPRAPRPGEELDYRCAITRPNLVEAWTDAWSRSDNTTIGKLLNYPDCCRGFFERTWIRDRHMDTTWPMYAGNGNVAIVPGGINMLWRWHGLRTVSHLPCSPTCHASRVQQDASLYIMDTHWPEETRWLREILSWPVKWTAFRGIAEITTPIHRTSVPTDAFAERLEVRYHGTGYPAEGVAGSAFPHRQDVKPLPFARMSNPSDNGFSSLAAMIKAHDALVAAAGGPYDTVLDLGCGDGTLARRIPAKRRIGVDVDPVRAERARKRLDRVVIGNCSDRVWLSSLLREEHPDLIIAQVDRNPPETLMGYRVLSYSYEDGAQPPRIVE